MVARLAPGVFALATMLVLSAASPPESETPDGLIRRANAAFLAGDAETAGALYAAAEERTGDPGLVAFNRAAVLFRQGAYRDAELHYARVLDDRACPHERAARAWFNRGTSLLKRDGGAAYRSAIACFEQCLDSPAADDSLRADARYNLELAKLLWIEANKAKPKPDTPNNPPPEEHRDPPAPKAVGKEPEAKDAADGNDANPQTGTRPVPSPGVGPKTEVKGAATPTPGNNPQLQPLVDTDRVPPLSPEETRAYLRQTDERLRREREGLLRALAGPDRPGVRDW